MESCPSFPPSSGSPFVLLAIVKESLKFLVLDMVLSACLIPTAVMLFFFSTPRLRRQPTFILNVIAIVLGLIQGALNYLDSTEPMLNEPEISIANGTFALSLYVLVPLCVESVLILRVIAVYPPRLLSRNRCFALYGSIALLKAVRVTNVAFVIYLLLKGPRTQNALSLAKFVWHMRNAKVEWLLQLIDDTYVSGLFLFRIYAGTRNLDVRIRGPSPYLERLKTLFWMSVSNFVFPVFLNAVQLAFILCDNCVERGVLVLMVNNYVTIIGVLLATIWASGSEAGERVSTRWRTLGRGRGSENAYGSQLEEKDPYAFSQKGRPRSAPPIRRSVVVIHVQQSKLVEVTEPSSMV